jgi:hypothetical protein
VILLAALAALALAVVPAGCGDDDDEPNEEPERVSRQLLDRAEQSASRSALASARRADDRYLPGPIELRTVCTPPEPAPPPNTPFQMKCHVEGYGTRPGEDTLRYMTYEDWLVPVDAQNRVGEATILGQARLRAYRRRDDRLNCTNRAVRPERCAPLPPGQSLPPTGPQGGAVPQGESVPP